MPFIVTDEHLMKMTPAGRRELLRVVSEDLIALKSHYADIDWDPEGTESFPLSVEEAHLLIRGMPAPAVRALKIFVDNLDSDRGTATLEELLEATGHSKFANVSKEFSWVLLRLRSVTANNDAWLFNWYTKDWVYDEEQNTYTEGKYFISSRAVESLREAFELEPPEQAAI